MNLIECKSLADIPLNKPLEPYPEAWGWTLEKAVAEYKRRHNQEPGNVYHIFGEYRFEIPEERK
jgi:hypothetical protein